jgi:hypothetical protein
MQPIVIVAASAEGDCSCVPNVLVFISQKCLKRQCYPEIDETASLMPNLGHFREKLISASLKLFAKLGQI